MTELERVVLEYDPNATEHWSVWRENRQSYYGSWQKCSYRGGLLSNVRGALAGLSIIHIQRLLGELGFATTERGAYVSSEQEGSIYPYIEQTLLPELKKLYLEEEKEKEEKEEKSNSKAETKMLQKQMQQQAENANKMQQQMLEMQKMMFEMMKDKGKNARNQSSSPSFHKP